MKPLARGVLPLTIGTYQAAKQKGEALGEKKVGTGKRKQGGGLGTTLKSQERREKGTASRQISE